MSAPIFGLFKCRLVIIGAYQVLETIHVISTPQKAL